MKFLYIVLLVVVSSTLLLYVLTEYCIVGCGFGDTYTEVQFKETINGTEWCALNLHGDDFGGVIRAQKDCEWEVGQKFGGNIEGTPLRELPDFRLASSWSYWHEKKWETEPMVTFEETFK